MGRQVDVDRSGTGELQDDDEDNEPTCQHPTAPAELDPYEDDDIATAPWSLPN